MILRVDSTSDLFYLSLFSSRAQKYPLLAEITPIFAKKENFRRRRNSRTSDRHPATNYELMCYSKAAH